jgi:NAD(P)-dependent dehydrogenase (short-subunit alcohol dehydrogenase family)
MLAPELDDRTALVTGSANGLGREFLLALAACGADVAVHYRHSDEAAADVADLARAADVSVTTVQGDVTAPDDVDALFDAVEHDLGPVDVLVNNVGAFAPDHWADIDHETWKTVIETNLDGTYLCSKRALPAMREAGQGRIVNVGYASAERALANPKNFPYFVAKTGVLMFTRMLAADTSEDGITVNAVSPYVVENSDEFPDSLPRGRPAAFEDVIQPLLLFVAPDSDYISGANVAVSGGWLPERV